jgi:site-specific DNA recombinase
LKKKIRAAVYTRVSTDKDEQKSSLEAQHQYYTDYCVKKGYELVELYSDEGISATSNNRKEFLKMIVDGGVDYHYGKENKKIVHFEPSSREPKFDLIICKDVSRFARNISSETIVKYLDEKGVSIHFENSSLKTGEGNWKFELSLYLTFAENESRDRSKKMKWSLKNKADQDKFTFSVLPYGFDLDEKENKYVVNEEEAEVVRQIFDMYVNKSMGVRAIALYLNNNGIPNKKGKGKWVDTTLSRMISSERYIGNVVVQKYTKHDVTGSGKRIIKDEGLWHRIENALDPIIDKELWENAQKVKADRTQRLSDNSIKGKRLSNDDYKGKIRCGKCQSHFTRLATNKIRAGEKTREYFYQCYRRRKHKECDMRGLSKAVLDREIMAIASKKLPEALSYDLDTEKRGLDVSIARIQYKIDSIESERQIIKDQIASIKSKIDLLFNQFLEGDVNKSLVKATRNKIQSLEENKQLLEDKLEHLNVANLEKSIQNVEKTYAKIEKLVKKGSFEYEEIVEIIDRVIVNEEKEFTVLLSVPTLISNLTFDEGNGEYIEEHFSDTGMDMGKIFKSKY